MQAFIGAFKFRNSSLELGIFNQCFYPTSVPSGSPNKIVIGVIGRTIVVRDGSFLMPFSEIEGLHYYRLRKMLIGHWQGLDCEVWELMPEAASLAGIHCSDLRSLLIASDDAHFAMACRAVQLLDWQNNHRYCGRCGQPTAPSESENALVCKACEINNYPRISPCVIVVVTRGDSCLLARQASWPEGLFSAVAGFLEAGESAEDALTREVFEEVGVSVGNPEYVGSQSWPFPGQLMLGFLAEATSEEITVDGVEISQAQWWQYDNLPPSIPPPTVMSGLLIQRFVDRVRG